MEKAHVEALREAIQLVGGQAKLAAGMAAYLRRPTLKQQTISYWLANEVLLDAEWWPAIEHVTEGRVTRHQLRPDVFSPGKVA